jgi:hypothetical protein
MCRKNQLWGLAVLAFGLGLLLGCCLESELTRVCFGFVLIAGGFLLFQKK